MTSASLLRAVESALRQQIDQAGGILNVSSTPDDTLQMLVSAPARWRVILQFGGYAEVPGTHGALQTATVNVVVQQARSLGEDAGADAHRDRAGDPPLLERVDQLRDWMRALRFASDSDRTTAHKEADPRGFRLRSGQWLVIEDLPTRQFEFAFDLVVSIGPPPVAPGIAV